MVIEPIHHIPLTPEYKSPFSAAFAVEDARIVLLSGCGPIPIYHAHPHDPVAEAEWLAGGIREQTEKTFANIETILDTVAADWSHIVKLNIFMTDIAGQDILNEISARLFDPANPPPRTLLEVSALAHPDMLIEIEALVAIPKRG
jgi:enamine deaminase RidA (YjgF/YER057c/UK114 family)